MKFSFTSLVSLLAIGETAYAATLGQTQNTWTQGLSTNLFPTPTLAFNYAHITERQEGPSITPAPIPGSTVSFDGNMEITRWPGATNQPGGVKIVIRGDDSSQTVTWNYGPDGSLIYENLGNPNYPIGSVVQGSNGIRTSGDGVLVPLPPVDFPLPSTSNTATATVTVPISIPTVSASVTSAPTIATPSQTATGSITGSASQTATRSLTADSSTTTSQTSETTRVTSSVSSSSTGLSSSTGTTRTSTTKTIPGSEPTQGPDIANQNSDADGPLQEQSGKDITYGHMLYWRNKSPIVKGWEAKNKTPLMNEYNEFKHDVERAVLSNTTSSVLVPGMGNNTMALTFEGSLEAWPEYIRKEANGAAAERSKERKDKGLPGNVLLYIPGSETSESEIPVINQETAFEYRLLPPDKNVTEISWTNMEPRGRLFRIPAEGFTLRKFREAMDAAVLIENSEELKNKREQLFKPGEKVTNKQTTLAQLFSKETCLVTEEDANRNWSEDPATGDALPRKGFWQNGYGYKPVLFRTSQSKYGAKIFEVIKNFWSEKNQKKELTINELQERAIIVPAHSANLTTDIQNRFAQLLDPLAERLTTKTDNLLDNASAEKNFNQLMPMMFQYATLIALTAYVAYSNKGKDNISKLIEGKNFLENLFLRGSRNGLLTFATGEVFGESVMPFKGTPEGSEEEQRSWRPFSKFVSTVAKPLAPIIDSAIMEYLQGNNLGATLELGLGGFKAYMEYKIKEGLDKTRAERRKVNPDIPFFKEEGELFNDANKAAVFNAVNIIVDGISKASNRSSRYPQVDENLFRQALPKQGDVEEQLRLTVPHLEYDKEETKRFVRNFPKAITPAGLNIGKSGSERPQHAPLSSSSGAAERIIKKKGKGGLVLGNIEEKDEELRQSQIEEGSTSLATEMAKDRKEFRQSIGDDDDSDKFNFGTDFPDLDAGTVSSTPKRDLTNRFIAEASTKVISTQYEGIPEDKLTTEARMKRITDRITELTTKESTIPSSLSQSGRRAEELSTSLAAASAVTREDSDDEHKVLSGEVRETVTPPLEISPTINALSWDDRQRTLQDVDFELLSSPIPPLPETVQDRSNRFTLGAPIDGVPYSPSTQPSISEDSDPERTREGVTAELSDDDEEHDLVEGSLEDEDPQPTVETPPPRETQRPFSGLSIFGQGSLGVDDTNTRLSILSGSSSDIDFEELRRAEAQEARPVALDGGIAASPSTAFRPPQFIVAGETVKIVSTTKNNDADLEEHENAKEKLKPRQGRDDDNDDPDMGGTSFQKSTSSTVFVSQTAIAKSSETDTREKSSAVSGKEEEDKFEMDFVDETLSACKGIFRVDERIDPPKTSLKDPVILKIMQRTIAGDDSSYGEHERFEIKINQGTPGLGEIKKNGHIKIKQREGVSEGMQNSFYISDTPNLSLKMSKDQMRKEVVSKPGTPTTDESQPGTPTTKKRKSIGG